MHDGERERRVDVPERERLHDGREHVAEDAESNVVHNYLFYRSRTIAGGTSEVQKNVIARELFGV